jgi:hypothetical protein
VRACAGVEEEAEGAEAELGKGCDGSITDGLVFVCGLESIAGIVADVDAGVDMVIVGVAVIVNV